MSELPFGRGRLSAVARFVVVIVAGRGGVWRPTVSTHGCIIVGEKGVRSWGDVRRLRAGKRISILLRFTAALGARGRGASASACLAGLACGTAVDVEELEGGEGSRAELCFTGGWPWGVEAVEPSVAPSLLYRAFRRAWSFAFCSSIRSYIDLSITGSRAKDLSVPLA